MRGSVAGLGADCVEKEMRDEHVAQLQDLLAAADIDADPADFRRYGSARQLYNFNVDNVGVYSGCSDDRHRQRGDRPPPLAPAEANRGTKPGLSRAAVRSQAARPVN